LLGAAVFNLEMTLKLIILCILLSFKVKSSLTQNVPLVETSLGSVQGVRRKTFKGNQMAKFSRIPYAKPPVSLG